MRHFRPVLSAISTVLVVTALARYGWAHTIAVARPDASDAILTESFSRLCGELRMYGLKVTLLESNSGASDTDEPPADLGGAGEVIGAVVLVRAAGQASAKIWIAEKAASKESVHITVSIDDADAPSLLAIRAADLLRASLRDFEGTKIVRPEPQPGADAVVAGLASGPSFLAFDRWSIQAGAGVLWETGELGAGFAPSVRLLRRISARLALAVAIEAPVMGQTYAAFDSSARMRQELGVLAIAWRVLGSQRLSLDLFQGLGVMHLTVRGEAPAPWVSQSASGWAAASSTGGSLVLHLSAHAGLTVSLAAVFVLPRPVLEVAAVSYGVHQPLLLTSGGIHYGF
jgi:hypothetical protein